MQYIRTELRSGVQREITYWVAGVEVGRFGMYEHGLWDMSIFIEDEFHGRGFARPMVTAMFNALRIEGVYAPAAYVYIDADASEGFWDHVGMTPNPNVEDSERPEYGYEKRITMQALSEF